MFYYISISNSSPIPAWINSYLSNSPPPQKKTRWWVVSNIFYFHHDLWKIPILTNIFQMGWNHQPEKVPLSNTKITTSPTMN